MKTFAARALPYCNCKVSGQQPFPSGSDPNETEKLLMRASGPQARSPDDLMISLIICSSRADRVPYGGDFRARSRQFSSV